ncbi:MAG: polyprenyl synthetase family protein [Acidimicrobiia bacterium]
MNTPPIRDLVPIDRVWKRMASVEHRLLEATSSEEDGLTDILQHLMGGGKRYRPLLALVTSELGAVAGNDPVEAAVAVELIHVGSLYHDDVIDEADSRRGVDSVNANWSNTVAILAGDFLLARASEVAAPLGTEAVALLARTYALLCEGQMLELTLANRLDTDPDDYFRVIDKKTASLIRTSARLGAMAGGASPAEIETATSWGYQVGMVFQLADDILDLVATEDFLGKPAGSDIFEGTFTLPVLLAAQGDDSDRIERLLSGGKPYDPDAVAEVIDLVRKGGHVDIALSHVDAHIARAERAVAALPTGQVRDVLGGLGRYLVQRVEAARSA